MGDWFSDKHVKHAAFRRIAAIVCPDDGCDEKKLQVRSAIMHHAAHGVLSAPPKRNPAERAYGSVVFAQAAEADFMRHQERAFEMAAGEHG
jgi:hypothetical protein